MSPVRVASLQRLGFRSYQAYLYSPLWQNIRESVLAKAKGRCGCCGDRAVVVHHKAYDFDTMRGANRKMLVAMCWLCHEQIEFEDEKKTTLERANTILGAFSAPPDSRRPSPEFPVGKMTERDRQHNAEARRAAQRKLERGLR